MIRGEGPIPSRIMIVTDMAEWDYNGNPVLIRNTNAAELTKMLQEAGILRSECYLTTIVKTPYRDLTEIVAKTKKETTPAHVNFWGKSVLPCVVNGYKELLTEIEMVQPNLIVTLGQLSLLALTGAWGITKWRGSHLSVREGNIKAKVIPTLSPISVFREWANRSLVVSDLRRAKREMTSREYSDKPEWKFHVRPSLETVNGIFNSLSETAEKEPLWLDFDIETRGGHIACVGISWSQTEGISIPFMCVENKDGYWTLEEETYIIYRFWKLTTHSNVKCRWQNGLFDAQFIYRNWHFIPNHGQDTMISQHSLFCALPKGLSFIASLFSPWYVYWKDEGKTWGKDTGEEQLWEYNLQDCVYTRVIGEELTKALTAMGLDKVDAFQQSMFMPVLRAMIRGVRVREEVAGQMAVEIQEELSNREAFLYSLLGHSINIASPKQMQALFYDDLKQPVIKNRKVINGITVMRPSCDDEALQRIAAKEPLLRPITNAIADMRTLGKFLNDFVMMKRDADGRMRCSFNIAGDAGGKSAPYSYRLSSGKNPFGGGGNLQTIPSDKSKSAGKAKARGSIDFTLPNIRSMYGPDNGFTFFDMDLDRADLQVVVWETNDEMLKHALHLGTDIHLLNVYVLDGHEPPPLEELVETHPKYPDHRGPRKHKREFAKVFCHATNYVGSAKTVAAHTGRGVHEVDRAQKIWFSAHPGIKAWHTRTEAQINKFRFVENRFNYRWYIFDRLDGLLPEAVAWIPQSTVGAVINRIWHKLHYELPEVQVLLQVHDSLAGQFPTHLTEQLLPKIQQLAQIVIPYEDPLIIPVGIKTSTVSWGDCK